MSLPLKSKGLVRCSSIVGIKYREVSVLVGNFGFNSILPFKGDRI